MAKKFKAMTAEDSREIARDMGRAPFNELPIGRQIEIRKACHVTIQSYVDYLMVREKYLTKYRDEIEEQKKKFE
jgi:hypothetical protein